jgi:hypothetical protein
VRRGVPGVDFGFAGFESGEALFRGHGAPGVYVQGSFPG